MTVAPPLGSRPRTRRVRMGVRDPCRSRPGSAGQRGAEPRRSHPCSGITGGAGGAGAAGCCVGAWGSLSLLAIVTNGIVSITSGPTAPPPPGERIPGAGVAGWN